MISYIVSSCNRPLQLMTCLSSLGMQQSPREIIICDNSTGVIPQQWLRQMKDVLTFRIIPTYSTPYNSICYHSLDYVQPRGDWLCFPSDDSYYVPQFSELMLAAAAKNKWEFVYCDMVYDPRLAVSTRGVKEYSVMITAPSSGRIDKTCFLITRRAFDAVGGWPPHPQDWRDGALAEAVVRAGIRHGRVSGPMVFHN